MKCKYCGAEIIVDSMFCRMCGKKVEKDEEQVNEEIIWKGIDNNADSADDDSFGFRFPDVMDFSDGDVEQVQLENNCQEDGFGFDDFEESSESGYAGEDNTANTENIENTENTACKPANTLWKQRVRLSNEIRLELVKDTVSVSKEDNKKGSERIRFAVYDKGKNYYGSEKLFNFSPEFRTEKFLNAWVYRDTVWMIGSNKTDNSYYSTDNKIEIFLSRIKYNGKKAEKCMDSITITDSSHSYIDVSFEMYSASEDPDRIMFVDENRRVFIIYNITKKKSDVIHLDKQNTKADFRAFENGILINGDIVYQDGTVYELKDMIDTERAGNGLMKYIFEDVFIEQDKILSEYYLNEQWLKDLGFSLCVRIWGGGLFPKREKKDTGKYYPSFEDEELLEYERTAKEILDKDEFMYECPELDFVLSEFKDDGSVTINVEESPYFSEGTVVYPVEDTIKSNFKLISFQNRINRIYNLGFSFDEFSSDFIFVYDNLQKGYFNFLYVYGINDSKILFAAIYDSTKYICRCDTNEDSWSVNLISSYRLNKEYFKNYIQKINSGAFREGWDLWDDPFAVSGIIRFDQNSLDNLEPYSRMYLSENDELIKRYAVDVSALFSEYMKYKEYIKGDYVRTDIDEKSARNHIIGCFGYCSAEDKKVYFKLPYDDWGWSLLPERRILAIYFIMNLSEFGMGNREIVRINGQHLSDFDETIPSSLSPLKIREIKGIFSLDETSKIVIKPRNEFWKELEVRDWIIKRKAKEDDAKMFVPGGELPEGVRISGYFNGYTSMDKNISKPGRSDKEYDGHDFTRSDVYANKELKVDFDTKYIYGCVSHPLYKGLRAAVLGYGKFIYADQSGVYCIIGGTKETLLLSDKVCGLELEDEFSNTVKIYLCNSFEQTEYNRYSLISDWFESWTDSFVLDMECKEIVF